MILRLKACMIVSVLQDSIWIKVGPNLRIKSLRDSDPIIFKLLRLLRPYFFLAKHK